MEINRRIYRYNCVRKENISSCIINFYVLGFGSSIKWANYKILVVRCSNKISDISGLSQVDLSEKPSFWKALKPPAKDKCGELLCSLCYHPSNSILTLTLLKARNLKAKDINGKSGDITFVIRSVLCSWSRGGKCFSKYYLKYSFWCRVYRTCFFRQLEIHLVCYVVF